MIEWMNESRNLSVQVFFFFQFNLKQQKIQKTTWENATNCSVFIPRIN